MGPGDQGRSCVGPGEKLVQCPAQREPYRCVFPVGNSEGGAGTCIYVNSNIEQFCRVDRIDCATQGVWALTQDFGQRLKCGQRAPVQIEVRAKLLSERVPFLPWPRVRNATTKPANP